MAGPSMQEVLAELGALRAEVRTLRRGRRRVRRAQRLTPFALVALLMALVPMGIFAANPFFSDLGDAAPVHRDNIQAIGNAGITTGFENPADPTARLYNPKGQVTREEMASFLARTAGFGTNPPVVNALTAVTATTATTATNANTVGGIAPSGLLRAARTLVPNNVLASPPQPTIEVAATYPAFQTIGTVTITAPASGFVLVMSQSVAASQNGRVVVLRLRDPVSGEVSPFVGESISPAARLETTISPIHIFPVAAGDRSFILEATSTATGVPADSQLGNSTISAVYIPFGSTGAATLGTDQPAPSGPATPGPLPLLGR